MSELKAVTVRMPAEEHDALRIYAFLTKRSINEAIVRAVRDFLMTTGGKEQFEAALEDFRTRYRVALDKLADL